VSKSAANISVIIPAYNRAGLIGATLRSLLNQTMPAKEIIVVDDGSTDGTAEAVEREFSVFREQFSGNSKSNIPNPTFKVLRQANAGPAAARNRGLAEATGEFIHFFDSDDIAAPNKHEVQLRALLETGADIAYGPWVKGRFAPKEAQTVASGELNVASLNSENTRYQLPSTLYSGFTPEGPVLQAWGLPKGDLVKALLTNWSVVPHACLFRKPIVEKAGAFPEELFGTEDQLMFLRCLLAGAKVVHTPGTFELYRVGDSGKITATGHAQKRHAREWAKFLVKANEEVSSAETTGAWGCAGKPAKGSPKGESRGSDQGNLVASAGRRLPAEAQCRGDFLTTDYTDKHGYQKNQNGNAQGTCAGAAFSNPSTSELTRASENTSLTRCASGSAEEALRADYMGSGSAGGNQLADSKEFLEGQSQAGLQMDNQKDPTIRTANDPSASREYSSSVLIRDIRGSNSATLDSSTPPAGWYGFRLRAYEAWRDLEKFFPIEEDELKENLERIFLQKRKFRKTETLKYQLAGFLLRKLGGLKLRVLGYRENTSFRCGKFSSFIDFGG
jgi:GT2 family glycosyltransferase